MLGVSVHYSIDFGDNSNLRQMLVSRFFFVFSERYKIVKEQVLFLRFTVLSDCVII